MKMPSGFVTKNTNNKNRPICNQPLRSYQNFSGRNNAYIRYAPISTDTASMINDSTAHRIPSLHAIAEVDISDRDGEKRHGNCYPQNVLHNLSPRLELFLTFTGNARYASTIFAGLSTKLATT